MAHEIESKKMLNYEVMQSSTAILQATWVNTLDNIYCVPKNNALWFFKVKTYTWTTIVNNEAISMYFDWQREFSFDELDMPIIDWIFLINNTNGQIVCNVLLENHIEEDIYWKIHDYWVWIFFLFISFIAIILPIALWYLTARHFTSHNKWDNE